MRWIVDDVRKFLAREVRRKNVYDAIILDPPSFGRGVKGEVFKIEEHLPRILAECSKLLSSQPLFVLLSAHTPGYSSLILRYLLDQSIGSTGRKLKEGDMVLPGINGSLSIPSGYYSINYNNK